MITAHYRSVESELPGAAIGLPDGGSHTAGQASSATQHSSATQPRNGTQHSGPRDLVLESDRPVEIDSLELHPGQCVRGAPGRRPLVVVPSTGLAIDVEDVRFENIDFVYDHPGGQQASVLRLHCGRAEFRGCSFRATGSASTLPAAIRWLHPTEAGDSALSLPSGRLQLSDCLLRSVAAGIDCRTVGALAVEMDNTLHLGSGPLVRLDHCPKADEPVLIALSGVTLRASGPVLECCCRHVEDQPGVIRIRASRCAFAPGPDKALLLFVGPQSSESSFESSLESSSASLLGAVQWTGQGSLVAPPTVVAAWQGADGRQHVLDDASVSIAGLVRSEVGFAGEAHSGPEGNRVIRWLAPLPTADPPGADPASLSWGQTSLAKDAVDEGRRAKDDSRRTNNEWQ
ncbi:MAG: hypothetical protein A2V70_20255 [Planctomycetes bacterium RBG_13_63_9]|nr:MAG: hypothetical protein A2V70_20255 [Planctomycetes bacterium RBG_13_63_9]